MNQKKIFITGATGLLGRNIIPYLVNEGYIVGGLTTSANGATLLSKMNVTPFIGDIIDKSSLENMIEIFKPKIIIHQVTSLKGLSSTENAEIRKIGTQNLVSVALKNNIDKLISQSIAWGYEAGLAPATEYIPLDIYASEPRKITIDGILTLENETKRLPHWVILRYGALYGKDTWYDKGGYIYDQFKQNEGNVSEGTQSFIHIEDASRLTLEALNWVSGIYNIVDNLPLSGNEWSHIYGKQINGGVKIFSDAQKWERGASNQKIKSLGSSLIFPTFKEGVKALV